MEEAPVLKKVPGSYGWPILGALKDRLDFFWFQGEDEYWASRVKKHGSTVFRTHIPPGPPFFSSNSLIVLLDQKSYPILFDSTKVEKRDVLFGNYMPSLSYTGGIRPCVYLDPSEEKHQVLKSYLLDLIRMNARKWIPAAEHAYDEIFPAWEMETIHTGKSTVNGPMGQAVMKILMGTVIGRDPSAPGYASLDSYGPLAALAWVGTQLAPTASGGLPHLLEELFLHTFRIPFFLVSFFYRRIEKFIATYGDEALNYAQRQYNVPRDEAIHNLVFFLGFNSVTMNIFLPSVVGLIGEAGPSLHHALAQEVRAAVSQHNGEISRAAIAEMPLVQSTIYEVLRMKPAVKYQFARAKVDLVVESHDGRYRVKKGELLGGFQPLAERDPFVFRDPDIFKADRFMGEEGKKLIKYVLWSNAPGNVQASATNKQCVASDLAPLLGHVFLAKLFLKYDTFSVKKPLVQGAQTTYYFSSFTKARAT